MSGLLNAETGCQNLQAAALRAERARWSALEAANAALQQEVATWKSRYQLEAARSDELAADCARLQSELLAAKLEVSLALPCIAAYIQLQQHYALHVQNRGPMSHERPTTLQACAGLAIVEEKG